MRLVLGSVADKGLELVVDAARLAGVTRRWLKGDTGRTMWRQLEEEGIGIFSQLLDQTLLKKIDVVVGPSEKVRGWKYLKSAEWPLGCGLWRVDLSRSQVQVLSEGQSQDVQVLATVAEGGQHVAKDLSILQVLGIDQDDAIYKRNQFSIVRRMKKCSHQWDRHE